MDVRVDAAGGQDHPLARNDFGAHADLEQRIDAVHDVAIAGLADRPDEPVLDAHVGFDYPPIIEHHHVGDDEIRRVTRDALAHAVADHFAATEAGFFTIHVAVCFDFQP